MHKIYEGTPLKGSVLQVTCPDCSKTLYSKTTFPFTEEGIEIMKCDCGFEFELTMVRAPD